MVKKVISVAGAKALCQFNRWQLERNEENFQNEDNTTQMHLEQRNLVVACTMTMALEYGFEEHMRGG